ncbi:hypothetical protein [Rhodococcus triatomae]|nr:hypothetical protein G419_15069 [Rhodococcus triatomae BKS 15-14]
MPPQRRNSNTPQPKGRTPKIAGRPTSRGEQVAQTGAEQREPTGAEQREPTPAGSRTESSAALSAPTPPPAGGGAGDHAVPARAEATTPADVPSAAGDAVAPTAADVPEGAAAESPEATASEEPQSRARPVNRASSLRPRAQAQGTEDAGAGDAVTAATAAGRRRVAVVGAVAVALAVFAVIAWLRPGGQVDNRAWVDDAETMQVTATARDAIQTLYTYGFETVDQDFDAARGVLTDDMRSQFDQTAQVTRDAVIQTKTKTNAEVTDIGVKLLSDDHAELVATMNVSATNDGAVQGSASGPLSVTMTRVDGEWLLADIRDR